MRRTAVIGVLVAFAAAFSSPSTSLAQEEGVTLDPNSPAAKEYDLPVDRIRRESSESSGGKKSSGDSGASVPFGEGIGNSDGTAATPTPAPSGSTAGADAEKKAEQAAAKKRAAKKKAAEAKAKREAEEAAATTPATSPTTPAAEPEATAESRPVSDAEAGEGSNTGLVLVGGGALAVLLAVGGSAAFRSVRGRTGS